MHQKLPESTYKPSTVMLQLTKSYQINGEL